MLQSMWSQRVGPDLVTEQLLCVVLMALRHAWNLPSAHSRTTAILHYMLWGEKKVKTWCFDF